MVHENLRRRVRDPVLLVCRIYVPWRIDEHEAKYGCKWTQRHGFRRMAMWADVPSYACSVLEDELTEWLMHEYGDNVRGGNYVNCRADCYARVVDAPEHTRQHAPAAEFHRPDRRRLKPC